MFILMMFFFSAMTKINETTKTNFELIAKTSANELIEY